VDARSDIYSLGRVLAEMLGLGKSPAPGVTTGLADIIRKCLATKPASRYGDAAAVAEDLRRHMADLPLAGVPNRSLAERWRKWRRRQPHALSRVKALLLAGSMAAAMAGLSWFAFLAPRFRDATQALMEGRVRLDRGDHAGAMRVLTRGAALIEGIPGGDRLQGDLADALQRAGRLEGIDRLHRLVDHLRLAESGTDRMPLTARDVERHCRAVWESRASLLDGPGTPRDPRVEPQLRDDLIDLAVIGSSLRVRLATDSEAIAEGHRAGLAMLDEAESLFGPSHVLYLARQAHARALGRTSLAEAAARDAARVPPRTAWEHDAAGRVWLAAGDLARAEASFVRALELRPQDFWPNFHQGVCAFRRGRYPDAVAAFRACISLAPDRAEAYYNRARALEAQGRVDEAARDIRRAVALDPTLGDGPDGGPTFARRSAPSDGAPADPAPPRESRPSRALLPPDRR
jgi:tetratricopeptide (TPR) repeat protein